MKKLLFLLLALMLLTACGQAKENGQEAVYVNITAEQDRSGGSGGAGVYQHQRVRRHH